tara:strand:+ start:755 stop:1300 length:546 start_codon:yes stop_codon:yes gene_type:complete
MTIKKQAVFLDRDGVINECIFDKKINSNSPRKLEEFKILPKVSEALSLIRDMNFLSIIVTNQPDVARGKINKKDVENIHKYLKNNFPINDIYVCYDSNNNSPYRKPNNMMLIDAAKKWNVSLSNSYLIGDRKKDIDAGKKSGCKTFFIDYNYDEQKPDNSDYIVKSLYEAVKLIRKLKNEN